MTDAYIRRPRVRTAAHVATKVNKKYHTF